MKGGTGKSTLAFHVMTALLYQGKTVASIDIDGSQGTFSRYLENRLAYKQHFPHIPVPETHHRISPVLHEDMAPLQEKLHEIIAQSTQDIIVIDTPGNDSVFSQYTHSLADLLITPINDSYIDLDLLINIQNNMTQSVMSSSAASAALASDQRLPLSTYANMVWKQRVQKAARKDGPLEWMILRNRIHTVISRNHQYIDTLVENLSKRIGFHISHGVGERVIFRELFGEGLTFLDKEERKTTLSHIAARHEIRSFLESILHFYEKFLQYHAHDDRASAA